MSTVTSSIKKQDINKYGRTKAAAKRAYDKYTKRFDMISFRVPKGQKDVVKQHAEKMNESLSQFLARAIATQIGIDEGE